MTCRFGSIEATQDVRGKKIIHRAREVWRLLVALTAIGKHRSRVAPKADALGENLAGPMGAACGAEEN